MIEFNNFNETLQKEIRELQLAKKQLVESLAKAPEGTLHVLHSARKGPQYYWYQGRKKRKYISKQNMGKACLLAKKEYDCRVLDLVVQRLEEAIRLKEAYNSSIIAIYSDMTESKRALLTPFIQEEEAFLKNWYDSHPGGMNSFPFHQELFSDRGEQVRSKSEKIISDLLHKYHIPYVYEPQLVLENGKCVYPDFLILNRRLRKTIVLEHFGLMSDGNYAGKACEKIQMYQANNYLQGDTFLFTMESSEEPLNTKIVVKLIEKYLL